MTFKMDNSRHRSNTTPPEPKSDLWIAFPQIIAVTVKNILLVAFGMTLGFPTILIPGLADPQETFKLSPENISWIGSINLICVPIGCILSGAISQAIGRKRAMQLVNIPFVIAWLLFKFSNAEWQVFLALALTGLTGGFLEAPVLTYVAEISQPHLRGMLSSSSSLAVILGVLIMFVFGSFFPWRTVALISCIFNVLSFNFLFFIPESPHWLISKNRLLDARKSLAWLRGWTTLDDIEAEYKQIHRDVIKSFKDGVDNPAFDGNMNGKDSSYKLEEKSTLETLKLYTKKNFLWPYSLVSFTFFICHFSGMTSLQTYAVPIFSSLHVPIDKYYATMILGLVELLGCIVCVVLVHYIGKRVLGFISIIGSGVCFLVVATYAYILEIDQLIDPSNNSNITNQTQTVNATTNGGDMEDIYLKYNWVPLTFLIGAAFISHAGIRCLPWILTGEVFSNETRASASGMCSAISYIFSFFANKVFFSMISTMTLPGTFWFYAAISFFGLIVLYFCLPETEGKTLGEINDHFNGEKKMGNHVYRVTKKDSPMHMGNINHAYVVEHNKRFDSRF